MAERFNLPKFKQELKEFYARMGLRIPEGRWKRFEEIIGEDEEATGWDQHRGR